MGTKKNDAVILAAQKQISELEAQLKKVAKFSPHTNCSLLWNGVRYNLHVIPADTIRLLVCQLNELRKEDEALFPDSPPLKIDGFTIGEWLTDLRGKYTVQNRVAEEKRLADKKARLEKILSLETKQERELADILKDL